MIKILLLFISTILFADVRVATAGNAAFIVQALSKTFYQKTNIKVIPIIGSSGKLAAQIEHGAPYDIYLSANMIYPEYLFKKELTITKPVVYARGRLVLFSRDDGISSLKDLLKAKKIAIANPKTAPYGMLAVDYLRQHHLYKKIKNKFVYAPNIAAALNYAITDTNYAFIAKSLLFKFPKYNNPKHYIELNDFYERTAQGAVLLKDKKEARLFFNFLFSKEAKKIFEKYGYDVN